MKIKSTTITKKIHFKFKNSSTFQKHLLKFGTIGFKVVKSTTIFHNQEEFLNLFLLKNLKIFTTKKIKIFNSFASFYSKTKLPLESRMGKGKGEIFNSFGYYKRGYILLEFINLSFTIALKLKLNLNKKNIVKFNLIKS